MKTLKIGALTLGMIFITSASAMDPETKAKQEAKLAGLEHLPTAEDPTCAQKEARRKPLEEPAIPPDHAVDAEGNRVDRIKKPLSESELKAMNKSWLRKIKAFPGACLRKIKAHPWIFTGSVAAVVIGAAVYIVNKQAQLKEEKNRQNRQIEDDDTIQLGIIVK